MNSKIFSFCAVLLALVLSVPLRAQLTFPDPADPTAKNPGNYNRSIALKLRRDLVAAILGGDLKVPAALGQLRASDSPSGLKLGNEADFAFAAIDVGQRLIVAGKPAEAEEFFREAEKSLVIVLRHAPDTAADEKVQYLSALALIRGRFLNNPTQAKADLEAAKKLRPEDKTLQGLDRSLGSRNAATFGDKPQKG